jgi:hypothetical protein
MVVEVKNPKIGPIIVASVEVDPAVAPFIAVKMTVVEFKVERTEMGVKSYKNIQTESSLEGEPNPEYSGSADLGTRVGTLESRPIMTTEWGSCTEKYYNDILDPSFWTGTFEWYAVAEVFLVDHKGGGYPLGTSTYWFQTEIAAS